MIEDFHLANFSITDIEEHQYLDNLPQGLIAAKIINEDDTCERLVRNIYLNQSFIILSPENKQNFLTREAGIKYLTEQFPFRSPTELYIETAGSTLSKLIICEDTITLHPLNPLRNKSVDGTPKRDTAFYIRLLLGICEEYPILEFKTTFEECC